MRAEAVVLFSPKAAAAAARSAARGLDAQCEFRPGSIRILGPARADAAGAMTAVAQAALALVAALKDDSAVIEHLKLAAAEKSAGRGFVSKGSLSKEKPKPQVLMSAVTATAPLPDNAREAFRNFMTARRLRPTLWAKEAGVASGEILGYLTGRSRRLSTDVAEKLARAAKVRIEDMFK